MKNVRKILFVVVMGSLVLFVQAQVLPSVLVVKNKTYTQVKYRQHDAAFLIFSHSEGEERVLQRNLQEHIQKLLAYDIKRAEAEEELQAERQQDQEKAKAEIQQRLKEEQETNLHSKRNDFYRRLNNRHIAEVVREVAILVWENMMIARRTRYVFCLPP